MKCGKFTPGHLVHWIQSRKAHEEGDMVPVNLLGTDAEAGRLVLEVNGERLEAWNHDVERVAAQAAAADEMQYSPRWCVLRVGDRGHCLAVDPSHWDPRCTGPGDEDGPVTAQILVDRLDAFGGFTARVETPEVDADHLDSLQLRAGAVSAIAAVQLMTGLGPPDARTVVLDGDHTGYDETAAGLLDDPDEPLGLEVRNVIDDCLDEQSTAGAWTVATLLVAMGAGWASAFGDTVELRLPKDVLALTGEGSWSSIEVPNDDGDVALVATGVEDDCPDPLAVAVALARLAPRHPDTPAAE